MDDLIVLTPDGAGARAVGGDAVVTGTGAEAVAVAVARLIESVPGDLPVAVAGTAVACRRDLHPGQVVVAAELCGRGVRLPSADLLAEDLRQDGLDVVVGPVATDGATSGHTVTSDMPAEN
ncbi:MAG: hypothetical protein ACRDYZ_07585, partial [Acidimicrobiales bacterium]